MPDDANEPQPVSETERARERVRAQGFPHRACVECTDYEPHEAYTRLRSEAPNTGAVYVLNGPVGTGKTQTATRYAMFRHILASRTGAPKTALYMTGVELHHAMMSDALAITSKCKRVSLLVIDEFDAVKDSEWYFTHLREIIKHRSDSDFGGGYLDTVLITNLTQEALRQTLDASVYDIACGRGKVYTLDGRSMR